MKGRVSRKIWKSRGPSGRKVKRARWLGLAVKIRRWPRACSIVALLLLLVGCSRKTDISGDVFVSMKSGDVKRAADALVTVVPASAAFEQERRALEESFQAAVRVHRERILPLDAAWKRLIETRRCDGHTCSDAVRVAGEAWKNLEKAVDEYQAKARELLQKHAIQTTRTDSNGHFEVKDFDRQKVYLHAEIRVFENQLAWLVPVELKERKQKVDLSGSNSGWPFQLGKGSER
jgi:hypothetical protein